MGYDLGIDLGGTTVVAAVLREGAHRGEPVPLGGAGMVTLPATAHRGSDGTVRTGEEAEQWAAHEPGGVVRDITARLGDDVPLVVGGEPWRADDVAAEIVLAAVRRVAAREGGAARTLAVTHPAGWGLHRERTLRRALVRVGLGHATLIGESLAAALAGSRGTVAGVYDLGGRSFRAAVVRRDPAGRAEVVADSGTPDRAGGTDVDAAVLALVREQLGDDLEAAREELSDDEARVALAGLRDAAHAAKERLSAETEAHLDVALGALRTTVRITRADLEARITPLVAATVESFASTVDAAGVPLDDVVLVGGSSRIPLVARLLAEELGRPVHPAADPVTVVAQGAALAAALHASANRRAAETEAPVGAGPSAAVTAASTFPSRVASGGPRHRAPDREVAARADEAATVAVAAAAGVEHDAADAPAAVPGRTATALLERPPSFTDDVPRPPVTTAEPPIGPARDGPLRRYRTWIVAGATVLVLGAAAATVPIPGLTSARSTAPAAPAPTGTPGPSASVAPTPAAPPPSTTPGAAPAPAGGGSAGEGTGSTDGASSGAGSSVGTGSSGTGSSGTGSSGTGSSGTGSSGTGSSSGTGHRSPAARPSATRSTRSPASFAQAPAAANGEPAGPAAPAPASPPPVAPSAPSSAAPVVTTPVAPAAATTSTAAPSSSAASSSSVPPPPTTSSPPASTQATPGSAS